MSQSALSSAIKPASVSHPLFSEKDAPSFLQNISSIMDGFMLSCENNAAYTVVHISDGFERIYGHKLADFMARGADYAALIHPDDIERVSKDVEDALRVKGRWRIQYRLRTATGEWREVLETGGGRQNPRSDAIEYLDCVITDFEQMHAMEDRIASGSSAIESIGHAVGRIVGLLDTLRMLSFNARIEAALVQTGAGFNEVAKEMADLANNGEGLAKEISTQLRRLKRVLR